MQNRLCTVHKVLLKRIKSCFVLAARLSFAHHSVWFFGSSGSSSHNLMTLVVFEWVNMTAVRDDRILQLKTSTEGEGCHWKCLQTGQHRPVPRRALVLGRAQLAALLSMSNLAEKLLTSSASLALWLLDSSCNFLDASLRLLWREAEIDYALNPKFVVIRDAVMCFFMLAWAVLSVIADLNPLCIVETYNKYTTSGVESRDFSRQTVRARFIDVYFILRNI